MAGQLVTRDAWIEVMEPRLSELFTFGLDDNANWKKYFSIKDSDMRREEIAEFRTPDVTVETPEGHPYVRLETAMVRTASVVHVDYTGYIEITHQMKRDKKYSEMEEKTWGLGEAVGRKPYEQAVEMLYEGLEGGVLSPDNKAWFATDHPLDNSSEVDVNKITDTFGAQGILSIIQTLLRTKNENGKPIPMGKGKIQIIVPISHWQLAQNLAHKGDWLPESANFNRNEFEIEPIVEPFFELCPYSFKNTMFFGRDAKRAKNYHYRREGPTFGMATDPFTDNTLVKVRDCHSFLIGSHRGVVGSEG